MEPEKERCLSNPIGRPSLFTAQPFRFSGVVECSEATKRSGYRSEWNLARQLVAALLFSSIAAAGAPTVAVLPFTGEDIDPGKLSEATRNFQSQLSSTDSFRIAPRHQVDALVRDSLSADSAACDNNDCSVRIGRMLGVQSVFTGIVSQEVETWRLEVSRTDVQSGKTTFDHLIEIYGSFDDLAGRGCYRMARMASGRESSENNYTVLDGGGGGHVWPWIVGGIALAAGGATAAVLLLTHDGSTPPIQAASPDRLIVKW